MTATKTRRRKKQLAAAAYRAGFSCPVDPDTAYSELESIRDRNDGVLCAATVVDVSRPDDAALHPVFTWDDEEAAELYRQEEARRLIRNVCVVQQPKSDDGPRMVQPVYIHTRSTEGRDTPGYQTVASVMSDDDMRQSAIDDALAQLLGWQKRYGWISELAGVSSEISKAAGQRRTKSDAA